MARLTERDWLDHGLKTLASAGFEALKAAKMAQALGVSRGSFYWHFEDIRQFEERLLDHWQSLTTDETIREMEAQTPASERLPELMRRASMTRPSLDRAVRVWAEFNDLARAKLRKVDALRIDYIAQLLVASGLDRSQAGPRARFIYAASLGDTAIAPQAGKRFTPDEVKTLARFLTTNL
ncbi:MAG: TetR family transcriptional regulator [Pseudomonadota bacterium]